MAEPDISQWLADHAVALETLEPGHGTADLAPLCARLSAVHVIGLGEAVVGTRELVQCTHRLLELLVEDLGVRVIALRSPEAATVALDEYVVGHRRSIDDVMESIADWRWNTRDVLRVITWLAQYNAEHAPDDHVRLIGVDPVAPAIAVSALGTMLREADPTLLDEISPSLQELLRHRPGESPALPDTVLADAERAARRITGRSVGDRPGDPVVSPDHDPLRRHAAALVRAARLAITPPEGVAAERERLVADAVAEAAPGPLDRPELAFWAHSSSVRVREDTTAPSAGALLRRRLDRGYYALGMLLSSGEFRANRYRRIRGVTRSPVVHRLTPPPAGTLEAALASVANTVVDLRADDAPEHLADTMRAISDPVPRDWKDNLEPVGAAEFDGVVHVARSRQALVR